MDFKSLKKKLSEQVTNSVNYWAKKLTESSLTIQKKEELETLIKKSKTTSFKNKETWVEKKYKHKTIVIFAEEWSEFFKDALYILPVIVAKAFTQNITVKLSKTKIEWIKLSDYDVKIDSLPSLVVFEEEKVLKKINGTQNILKLVKSFDLDINKLIDNA